MWASLLGEGGGEFEAEFDTDMRSASSAAPSLRLSAAVACQLFLRQNSQMNFFLHFFRRLTRGRARTAGDARTVIGALSARRVNGRRVCARVPRKASDLDACDAREICVKSLPHTCTIDSHTGQTLTGTFNLGARIHRCLFFRGFTSSSCLPRRPTAAAAARVRPLARRRTRPVSVAQTARCTRRRKSRSAAP